MDTVRWYLGLSRWYLHMLESPELNIMLYKNPAIERRCRILNALACNYVNRDMLCSKP